MAQLSDDCFAFGGALLPLEAAQARIAELYAAVVAQEVVPLGAAGGRVLAEDVIAPSAVPPVAKAAVDGYAVRHADLAPDRPTVLPLAGRITAGHPPDAPLPPGHAGRVFTGAVVPEGADTVMMQ